MNSHRPSVLIAAAKWWSPSARLAISLLRNGCGVSALCPAHHPLTFVTGLDRVLRYGGIESLENLRRALQDIRPAIIVPCDDGVVAQLHALHAGDPSLRPLIEESLGPPSSYPIAHSRYRLLATAAELGIPVAETVPISGPEDLIAWHRSNPASGVLKLDCESGGNGVRFSASLDESLAAWQELHGKIGLITAWKRLAIDRDPLALWTREHAAERGITMQRVINGRPANSMFAAKNGSLLGTLSVIVLAANGRTGAAMIIRRVIDERMGEAARKIAARLKLTGFYGLDFMLDAASGVPYLIEMNPRCTQLGHLAFADQPSLAQVFSIALRAQPIKAAEIPVAGDTIALFPASLALVNGPHRYTESTHLDAPADERALHKELQLDPWPQRQWLARRYHVLRPLRRSHPVEFEAAEPALIEHRDQYSARG